MACVAFAAFMSQLDSYIVNVSLPTISRYFAVSPAEASRVIISYLLMVTSTLLFFSKVAERVGLKRMFVAGYLVFVAGSFLCGISPTINTLVISRALQGLGGAMLFTAAFAIIPRFLPKTITGWAFGILSTAAASGVLVGAPLGGVITAYISWRWVFLVNVPFGFLAAILAHYALPRDSVPAPRPAGSSFDATGTFLSFFGLVAFLYGLDRAHDAGWGSPLVLGTLAIAVILLTLFFINEKKCSDPLLDLSIFRDMDFTYANIAPFMGFMLLAGTSFLMPFYLEMFQGLKTEHVGLLLTIYSLVMMGLGPMAGKMSDGVDPRIVCTIAMLSGAAACIVFASTLGLPGLFWVVVYLFWVSTSFAFFISPENNLAMGLAPREQQSVAAGIYTTITRLGLVMGVSFFESIFSHYTRIGTLSKTGASGHGLPPGVLTGGFRYAYLFGALLGLLAALCCLLARREKLKKLAAKPAADSG